MHPSALHTKTTTDVPGSNNSPFLEEGGASQRDKAREERGRGLGCIWWKGIVE
jgi:hypothetical protein